MMTMTTVMTPIVPSAITTPSMTTIPSTMIAVTLTMPCTTMLMMHPVNIRVLATRAYQEIPWFKNHGVHWEDISSPNFILWSRSSYRFVPITLMNFATYTFQWIYTFCSHFNLQVKLYSKVSYQPNHESHSFVISNLSITN